MVHYHDFLVELPRYAALGKANDFPTLNCCPICRAKNRLQRHGFYERNVISEECSFRIPICRLLCPDCGRTVSILPMFVLPYFQYTVDIILRILLAFWMTCGLCTRQQRRFYESCIWEVNGNGAVLSRGRFFGDAADYTQGKSHKDDPDDPSFGESNLPQKVVASSDKQLYGSTIIPWRAGGENRITFPHTFFLAIRIGRTLRTLQCPQRLAG